MAELLSDSYPVSPDGAPGGASTCAPLAPVRSLRRGRANVSCVGRTSLLPRDAEASRASRWRWRRSGKSEVDGVALMDPKRFVELRAHRDDDVVV